MIGLLIIIDDYVVGLGITQDFLNKNDKLMLIIVDYLTTRK